MDALFGSPFSSLYPRYQACPQSCCGRQYLYEEPFLTIRSRSPYEGIPWASSSPFDVYHPFQEWTPETSLGVHSPSRRRPGNPRRKKTTNPFQSSLFADRCDRDGESVRGDGVQPKGDAHDDGVTVQPDGDVRGDGVTVQPGGDVHGDGVQHDDESVLNDVETVHGDSGDGGHSDDEAVVDNLMNDSDVQREGGDVEEEDESLMEESQPVNQEESSDVEPVPAEEIENGDVNLGVRDDSTEEVKLDQLTTVEPDVCCTEGLSGESTQEDLTPSEKDDTSGETQSQSDAQLRLIALLLEEASPYKLSAEQFSGGTRDKEYLIISENLMHVLLKLDQVDTNGDSVVREARRRAVHELQASLDLLDSRCSVQE